MIIGSQMIGNDIVALFVVGFVAVAGLFYYAMRRRK